MGPLRCTLSTVYLLLLLAFAGQARAGTDPAISLTVAPSAVIKPRTDVSLTCTLDSSHLGSGDAIWQRKQGSVVTRIGLNFILDNSLHVDDRRYSLSHVPNKPNSYILTIRDAKYEDSGVIECLFGKPGSQRMSSVVLAVCDDSQSTSCKCMQDQEGWASPQCFKEPDDWVAKNKGYKDAVVVLGVLLGVVILIGIGLALLAGKDCMARAMVRQKRNAERRVLSARTNGAMLPTAGARPDDMHHLTLDPNDSFTELNSGGSLPQQHTSQAMVAPPRQRGRRAERQQQDAYGALAEDRDDRSDSGVSSTNASSVAMQQQQQQPSHAHQDSSSSTSSHGGARPKQPYRVEGSPPPSYKNMSGQRTLPTQPQRSMYRSREDLSVATPYSQSDPSVTPRSVQSEQGLHSPSSPQQPPARGAYTDVPRAKQGNGTVVAHRGYYTDPRKLDFKHGESGGSSEGQAYVDQNSTVI